MFKTFPEFSKLTLADREEYESLVKDSPPIGDLVFAGLMTWWNPFGHMSVSLLNDENLVIPYWLPGDDENSGLSLIGTHNVDESFCTIFDYLREKGERPRLVNVPEFVIGCVRYPEIFNFSPQRSHDEYVLARSQFYPLENMNAYRRRKVSRVVNQIGEDQIVTRSLDLGKVENRELLRMATIKWQGKNLNNYGQLEREVIGTTLSNASSLGAENVCLFVNGSLHGFCLYTTHSDGKYIVLHCIKATNKNSLGFELMAYAFSRWFAERGIVYANVNSDYGLMRLRMFMLTLGPVNFFRKYIVEPV